jgi:hypothetical protein
VALGADGGHLEVQPFGRPRISAGDEAPVDQVRAPGEHGTGRECEQVRTQSQCALGGGVVGHLHCGFEVAEVGDEDLRGEPPDGGGRVDGRPQDVESRGAAAQEHGDDRADDGRLR